MHEKLPGKLVSWGFTENPKNQPQNNRKEQSLAAPLSNCTRQRIN
jgi:hypothetical protein